MEMSIFRDDFYVGIGDCLYRLEGNELVLIPLVDIKTETVEEVTTITIFPNPYL